MRRGIEFCLTACEKLNDLEVTKNKKARTNYRFELLLLFDSGLVESEGIEPSSREDKDVLSTCLVDFNCREQQGRQQPKPFRIHLS